MTIPEQMINPSVTPSGTGCVECETNHTWWFHLRRCAACGHIGCCDDSLNRHASTHAVESGHEVIQSFEPGEDWFWDYQISDYIDGPQLADPQSHPADQSVPGPSELVPRDWVVQLTANRT